MPYVSFRRADGTTSYGRIDGGTIRDCGAVPGAPADLKAAIAAGPLDDIADGPALAASDVLLLPVLPNPGKILCVGHNYESHRVETVRAKVDNP